MTNQTLGTSFARVLHGDRLDVSSAEWIVEAPTVCLTADLATCAESPLSDFGSTGFTRARAGAAGRTGTMTGPGWTATASSLATGPTNAAGFRPAGSPSEGSRAVPGAPSRHADSFGVAFIAD
jgi:hypothetical protein